MAAVQKVEISKMVLLNNDSMDEIAITRISSKGQIVIPKNIRDHMKIKEGDIFAIIGGDDSILLKKVYVPTKEDFEETLEYGRRFAEEHEITRADVEKAIEEDRRERGGKKKESCP